MIILAGGMGLQGKAYADECRFANGDGGTATLNGATTFGVHWAAYNGSATMEKLVTFRVPLDKLLKSECGAGNDGHSLLSKIAFDTANAQGRGPQADGEMGNYYLTNIPGIQFSVKIRSPAGGGFFGGNGSEQVPGWTTLVDTSSDIWDGQTWDAEVTIWQANGEFIKNPGNRANATYITPASSFTLGEMALGDPNGNNNRPWKFNVTPASFQVPIVPSTCQTAQLDSGSNNVDLGEFMLSDFNASPRTHGFRVQLLGCDNLYAVDFKVTANETTGPQNMLLGNTLQGGDAATGVGVLLRADSEGVYVPPNSPSITFFSHDTGAGVNMGMLTFSAQLVKDGNPLKAGNFKGMSTFVMTYY